MANRDLSVDCGNPSNNNKVVEAAGCNQDRLKFTWENLGAYPLKHI